VFLEVVHEEGEVLCHVRKHLLDPRENPICYAPLEIVHISPSARSARSPMLAYIVRFKIGQFSLCEKPYRLDDESIPPICVREVVA